MANNSPTIVAASLSDDQLKKSIDSLVTHVDEAMKKMVQSTNNAVGEMEAKLKSLGNLKIGSGNTNDGGASKRTKAQNEETEAIEKNIAAQDRQIKKNQEAATSYDQMAAAIQKASRMPSEMRPEKPETRARDSYYAFVAGLKEQRDSLAKVINDFERGLNNAISKRTNEINNQITASKNKIQELNQELNRANATRNEARASQVQGQLDKELRHYKDLESQLKNVNNEFGTSKISLAAMNAEHHRLANLMREETQVQQQQITEEQRRTEEIRKQAAAIRATKTWQEQGVANVNGHVFYDAERVKGTKQHIREIGTLEEQILRSMQQQSIAERDNTQEAQRRLDTIKGIAAAARAEMEQYGTSGYNTGYAVQNPYIYAENDARAKGLTIEQQIANILREQEASYQASARSAAMVVEEEKKITQEQDKRKSYKAPVSAIGESFKQLTANALGVQPSEIESASTKISKMTTYVRQLETAYSNLTREEQRSPFGKQLREEIQITSLKIQKFRSEISRPINLQAALQGSEKTLDDIAYKMQRLSSYRSGLNIETQKDEIDQVNRKYAELQKKMNEVMAKNQQMIGSNTALGRSWNYMKNRLAFYFSVGASTQFIKNLVDVRSQYEMNERALGILINSAERGTQIFNELSQMSLVSPYTLIELSSAAKQLTAYDIAARDVVDTTRRLADMASAVGVPIERLTYALGQIKAYGYLNSRDQRMFANAGIPLAGELAKYYTEIEGRLVSTGDVYDRIKKKAVDYNTVMQVMYRMTDEGGKFFDFQAKMADTLKVRLANLTLAWNNMLNDMGKETQGVLTWGIGALRTLFLHWKELDKLIKNVAWVVGMRTAFMLLTYGVLKLGGALGVTTKQMALSAVVGKRLAGVLRTVGGAMNTLAMSKVTWFLVLAEAAWEAGNMIFRANQSTVELNKSLREGAETNFKDISEYLSQYQKVADSLYSGKKTNNAYDLRTGKVESEAGTPTNINVDEANKAWEAMRERIELSTAAGDEFIGRLLTIENVSERLRQGFILLNDIQQVNSAMKEMGDTAIVVTQDWSKLWDLWLGPDGLIDNLGDAKDELDDVVKKFGSLEEARKQATGTNEAWEEVSDYDNAMETLKGDIDKTTESLNNFIRSMGFASNPDQIAEVYAQALQKISAEGNLDPQRGYILQKSFEEARGKAMKEALEARIADEEHALKLARDNETKASLSASIQRHEAQLELFTKYTDDQRAEWERFTKYMKENHISEMQAMFGQMDEEQISHINWQEGKYLDFVKRTAAAYAKRHNMAYKDVFNRLWGLINKTNLMQIFLKLTISTEGQKSLYETLKAGDDRINQIDTEIERLKKISALSSNYAQAQEDIVNLEKERTELKAKDAISSKEEKDAAKAAKDAARGRKSADAAARKAQREAESELQKALKDELSTIDKVRSIYKDLTKEGMSHANAVERATKGWDETVNAINRVLQKNGLQKLDLSKFAGIENPRELVNMLQSQLNTLLKRGAKPAEIKELQTKVNTLEVEADKYDLTKITQGLNSELGKLKEEYELAVELDANPELGGMFADFMGINMNELPKTFQEATKKAQEYIDKVFQDNGRTDRIDIASMLDKESFDKWVKDSGLKMDSELVKSVEAFRQYLHKTQVDETKKQIDEWSKLLEKYAEYEYKLGELRKQYERETEIAQKQNAPDYIIDAIKNKYQQAVASLNFEEFQKGASWIMATGDVSKLTDDALILLIKDMKELRAQAKNLPSKDILKLNKAIRQVERQVNKNPFKTFSRSFSEAQDNVELVQQSIDEVMRKLDIYDKKQEEGIELTEDERKEYHSLILELEKLKKLKDKAGNLNATEVVQNIQQIVSIVQQAAQMFEELAVAIGGKNMTRAAERLKDTMTIVEKAAAGAAAAAQISGGNGWAAAAGGVLGALTGVIQTQADRWSGNRSITNQIKDSTMEVKKLEVAYTRLQYAVEQAYGISTIGAQQAARANKELELAELRRQYRLEESRKRKNRDEEKIQSLRNEIAQLEQEINDLTNDIVNDLLGISGVGDAMESLMDGFIEALRNGEDAMKVFDESIDDMIANMIKKMFVTKILQPWFEKQWDYIQKTIDQRSKKEAEDYEKAKREADVRRDLENANEQQQSEKMWEDGWRDEMYDVIKKETGEDYKGMRGAEGYTRGRFAQLLKENNESAVALWRKYLAKYYNDETEAFNALQEAQSVTSDDIRRYADLLRSGRPMVEGSMAEINSLLKELGLYSTADKQLSALQQGIQGITEDTAGALEAITNGISQQCYLQSDILTQIRDTVQSFDIDIQTASLSQILLQLQQSYQTQQAIQQILEGVLVPSGRAFAVELLS